MTIETSNPLHDNESRNESHGVQVQNSSDDHGHGHEEPLEPYVRPPGLLGKVHDTLEDLFHIRKRGTTINKELVCGVIQWISCLYVLPVVPEQMGKAGYSHTGSIVATAACCCLGNLYGSVLTNMPFIIAPPTSVSIFLVVFLRQQALGRPDGNCAVVLSGLLLMIIGIFRPLGTLVSKV